MVVGFDPSLSNLGTLTETFTVNLLHPCKLTVIKTTQTILDIVYPLGNPSLSTPFVEFGDTVSGEYGVIGLCGLVYSLELAADATRYGTSIIAGAPP